jgi:hypothetical protein
MILMRPRHTQEEEPTQIADTQALEIYKQEEKGRERERIRIDVTMDAQS